MDRGGPIAVHVLALDTSSRTRAIALIAASDGSVVRSDVRSGTSVGSAVTLALAELRPFDVAAVVAVVGPGAYTGLRAGLAAAAAVAHARGLPLHGVGSLDVVAAGCRAAGIGADAVAVDAGRGAVYLALCTRAPARFEAGTPQRCPLAVVDPELAVASTDPLPLRHLVAVDPVRALAASVAAALTAPPLRLNGLAVVYVE